MKVKAKGILSELIVDIENFNSPSPFNYYSPKKSALTPFTPGLTLNTEPARG